MQSHVSDLKIDELIFVLRDVSVDRLRLSMAFGGFVFIFACVIAGLQPAATHGLPFFLALIHWALHIVVSIFFVGFFGVIAAQMGMRLIWAVCLAILILPFALTPISLVIETWMAIASDLQVVQADSYLEELRHVALPAVGLTSLVALLAMKAVAHAKGQKGDTHLAQEPNLFDVFPELSRGLGPDLLSLRADDHYVHLRTTQGSAMLTRKFSDCVDRLAPFAGQQVHRSHWVSHQHIVQIARCGSSYQCVLSDGSQIPVSRRRYADLKRVMAADAGTSS